MPQQIINLGATGSGAGGDSARTAFEKAIANFAELYIAALPGTAAQKQAARNVFGLGAAATRDVQASPTDPAAGLLQVTGAWGWGLANTTAVTDCDATTLAGAYTVSGVATGRPPGVGSSNGSMLVMPGGISSRCTQIFFQDSTTAPGAWIRHITGSTTFGEWRSLVGERGSNANGNYMRLADGTQVCWLGTANAAETNTRLASIALDTEGAVTWTFPAEFASTPEVIANYGSSDAFLRVIAQPQRKSSRSTTAATINWWARRPVASAVQMLDAVAIGRWY